MRSPTASPAWQHGFDRRTSGVLLHVTSLPGPHDCGDLGAAAHRFVEFLEDAGQSWRQMLPINPPGRAPSFSPYDAASAFAGSPWLVSLTDLADQGLLLTQDLTPSPGLSPRRVNFPATLRHREEGLRRAFANFRRRRGERTRDFRDFCAANADWLEDFALFAALRRHSGGKPWTGWEKEVRTGKPSAVRAAGDHSRTKRGRALSAATSACLFAVTGVACSGGPTLPSLRTGLACLDVWHARPTSRGIARVADTPGRSPAPYR